MIVSLYLWGGAQRAERCRWCLSCSQCRHYKPDWFYVGLWTEPFASERPRNWFLQNIIFSRMGSKCFPPLINCRHRRGIEFPLVARLVSVYVERSDDGHLGSAGDCRWGELCWSFTVYEYSSETFRSGCVLSRFALSRGARRVEHIHAARPQVWRHRRIPTVPGDVKLLSIYNLYWTWVGSVALIVSETLKQKEKKKHLKYEWYLPFPNKFWRNKLSSVPSQLKSWTRVRCLHCFTRLRFQSHDRLRLLVLPSSSTML